MDVSNEFLTLASPLTVLDNWAKEPDACWSPESTGDLTVVLEVGASLESAARLAIDAKTWLESPGTTVKACITIDLSGANNITIDVYTISTRNRLSRAIQAQHAEIVNSSEMGPKIYGWATNENTDSSPTDEIRLDFAMFVGRPATTAREKDIIIDRNLLIQFANRFWYHQGRPRQG